MYASIQITKLQKTLVVAATINMYSVLLGLRGLEIKQVGKRRLDRWKILVQDLGAEKDQWNKNGATDNNDVELNTVWRLR